MPDRFPTQRLALPPSTITGELYIYLQRVAVVLNNIPRLSYTSYTGGPNSNLTGAPGDLAVNIVASNETSRLYYKATGSGNTGWRSFATL